MIQKCKKRPVKKKIGRNFAWGIVAPQNIKNMERRTRKSSRKKRDQKISEGERAIKLTRSMSVFLERKRLKRKGTKIKKLPMMGTSIA